MKGEKKKKKKEDERWLALERKDGLRKKFAGWVSRRVEVRSWGFFCLHVLMKKSTIYGARHEPKTLINIGLFHLNWFAVWV